MSDALDTYTALAERYSFNLLFAHPQTVRRIADAGAANAIQSLCIPLRALLELAYLDGIRVGHEECK